MTSFVPDCRSTQPRRRWADDARFGSDCSDADWLFGRGETAGQSAIGHFQACACSLGSVSKDAPSGHFRGSIIANHLLLILSLLANTKILLLNGLWREFWTMTVKSGSS